MNDNKRIYTVKWTQLYDNWIGLDILANQIVESILEESNMDEAKAVIAKVMEM